MPLNPFNRSSRRSLLVEFNPFQVLVAGVSRPSRGPVLIECAAEFDRGDTAALDAWIEENFDSRKNWMTAICGLVARDGLVQRESVVPRKLSESGYLANLIDEQQARRSLSATPFKSKPSGPRHLHAVSALDGTALPADGSARPALVCGLPDEDVHAAQQRLLDHRLMPGRLEPALLSLFGALYDLLAHRGDARAPVVVTLHDESTSVYILGKEGIHTPNPLSHGFASIVQGVQKEFGLATDAAALERMAAPDAELLGRADRILRGIGRDLKPVMDSYEMTTGQPVEEVYCAYIPSKFAWIAERLTRTVGRAPLPVDVQAWTAGAGLRCDPAVPVLGPHWLGALELVAHLPEAHGRSGRHEGVDVSLARPWHVDCRLSADLPGNRMVNRRFVTDSLAAALAVSVLVLTLWQLFAIRSLRADTDKWRGEIAANQGLFDQLSRDAAELKEKSARLDLAYSLMASPYAATDLMLSFGRTLPARMRLDRIEANDSRVVLTGAILEPAEDASRTLGEYMESLRRDPAIGPLFSNIAITSLQREGNSEVVAFEVTLRLNPPPA